MSDANYSSIAFQREPTWGTTPPSPALTLLRLTKEEMMHDKATVISEEVRSDRQVSDLALVGSKASGKLSFELSYKEFWPFFEAALFTTFKNIALTAESCNLTASTQRVTAVSGTPFTDVVVGGSIRIAGAATAGNNGIKHVVGKATDGSYIVLAPASIVGDESAVDLNISSKMLRNGIDRSSFLIERAIQNTASAKFYQSFAGMMVDGFTLDVQTQKIITGEFSFMGKIGTAADESLMASTAVKASRVLTFANNAVADETVVIGAKTYTWKSSVSTTANQVKVGASIAASIANLVAAITGGAGSGSVYGSATVASTEVTATAASGTTMLVTALTGGTAGNAIATTETMTNASFAGATLTGGTDADPLIASTTNPVMNGTSNVGSMESDGAALQERFKNIKIDLKNNLRGLDAIGEAGNFDVGVGRVEVTGSFQAYFRDNDLYQAFLSHQYKTLRFTVTDGDGNAIVIFLPRINFMKGNPGIPGVNTDVMIPMDFTAILSPDYGSTIFMSFIPAGS
jgi:hypothetical protein